MDYAKILYRYDRRRVVVEYKNNHFTCYTANSFLYRPNSVVLVNVSPFFIVSLADDDCKCKRLNHKATFNVYDPVHLSYI